MAVMDRQTASHKGAWHVSAPIRVSRVAGNNQSNNSEGRVDLHAAFWLEWGMR